MTDRLRNDEIPLTMRDQDSTLLQTETKDMVFEKLVWSVDDVAKELNVSISHVYNLINKKQIPYSKVGRSVRFSPLRLREWLRKGGTR